MLVQHVVVYGSYSFDYSNPYVIGIHTVLRAANPTPNRCWFRDGICIPNMKTEIRYTVGCNSTGNSDAHGKIFSSQNSWINMYFTECVLHRYPTVRWNLCAPGYLVWNSLMSPFINFVIIIVLFKFVKRINLFT